MDFFRVFTSSCFRVSLFDAVRPHRLPTVPLSGDPLRHLRNTTMNRPAKRPWLWPVAIVLLFLLLFVGSVWLARVAIQVGEIPIDTTAQPAVRGGGGP